MAEIGRVGGGGVSPQNQNATGGDQAATSINPANAPLAGEAVRSGAVGQPTGLPPPVAPQTGGVLTDVLAGRDPSQMVAAERMRATGGASSATEELLGLNRQPSILGAFGAPPGNTEILRHMTPTMRRTIMRNLLQKQRARMRHLSQLMRRDERNGEEQAGEDSEEQEYGGFAHAMFEEQPSLDEAVLHRARHELHTTARMLDLLDEMLAMQDYTFSQMGTFSQG